MIAISTAFKSALLAVDINGKQECIEMNENAKHSEQTLATLDLMLDKIGASIKDNDVYAVVVGPGSFTGLRIGLALVKGLCAGNPANVVPVSSLQLIAYSFVKSGSAKTNFTCVLNALSGLFFVCEFDKTGKAVSKERLVEQSELDNLKNKVCLEGDGLSFTSVEVSAQNLLELANKLVAKGQFADVKTLSPVYLRKSQAEAALDAKKS